MVEKTIIETFLEKLDQLSDGGINVHQVTQR